MKKKSGGRKSNFDDYYMGFNDIAETNCIFHKGIMAHIIVGIMSNNIVVFS